VVPAQALTRERLVGVDLHGYVAICLSYLDPRDAQRAPLTCRRLTRRARTTPIVLCRWIAEGEDEQRLPALARTARSLREAVATVERVTAEPAVQETLEARAGA